MQNEGTELNPKSKAVLARILIPLCWTLWSVLLLLVLYLLFRVATERDSSPEAPRGLGVSAVAFILLLLGGVGWLLSVAARKQSTAGLITMTVLLAYPLVMLVAQPIVMASKRRSFEQDAARVGDFTDSTLQAMAQAIRSNDTLTLTELLNGQPPPDGKDRAGNDLLMYALVVVRDKQGSAASVRALLDAGADPRKSRAPNGVDVVNFMVYGGSPDARQAMRLLLEHGADPNAADPRTGETPLGTVYNEPEIVRALVEHGADIDRLQPDSVPAIVRLIGLRQWESALYLIEKGARLDVSNANGLSVDYYLKDFNDRDFGDQQAGWDSVRAAISRRRR